ncbi:uncharacterized protein LOC143037001 [Oratosquilla oratoria]|uniref:uncharacterized protein LOC143037001 n=1 Tax=Oratosquilla oratoria TaxID=337810 RepID=UPI003F761C20
MAQATRSKANEPSDSTSDSTSDQLATSQVTQIPVLNLIHQKPAIQTFDGNDSSYTASLFIRMCEDAIISSNITTDKERISFIRSQITPNSLASEMLSASCLNPIELNHDYNKFKTNFLQLYGDTGREEGFQWCFKLAEQLTVSHGTLNFMRSQAKSSTFVTEAIASLKQLQWIENDNISVARFQLVLEYLLFMLFLTPHERRIASSLDYTKDETLLHYATRLSKKLKEMPRLATLAQVVHNQQSSEVHSLPSPPSSNMFSTHSQSISSSEDSIMSCAYCHKQGHTYNRCFLRKRHERQSTKFSPLDSHRPSPPQMQHNSRKPRNSYTPLSHLPQDLSQMSPQHLPKDCLVHGSCGHTSEQCFRIKKLRADTVASAPTQSHFQRRLFPNPKT